MLSWGTALLGYVRRNNTGPNPAVHTDLVEHLIHNELSRMQRLDHHSRLQVIAV